MLIPRLESVLATLVLKQGPKTAAMPFHKTEVVVDPNIYFVDQKY
jgi:hypothetical protein